MVRTPYRQTLPTDVRVLRKGCQLYLEKEAYFVAQAKPDKNIVRLS
jgi:hypothetical protein